MIGKTLETAMQTTEASIRATERGRIAAILSSEEAVGRRDLALELALSTAIDVQGCLEIMSHATRVDPSAPPVAFAMPDGPVFTVTRAAPTSIVSFDVFERRRREAEAYRARFEDQEGAA